MKKVIVTSLLSILCATSVAAQQDPWQYVDFDQSMRPQDFPKAIYQTYKVMGIDGRQLYTFFKELYQRNNLTQLRKKGIQLKQKIPKIIHQIWIGGPLPEAFHEMCASWKHYHTGRGWLYKLWTDADVPGLKMYNKKYFDQSTNPGIRSDLMRLEILDQFGGIYVDTDYECLQPFDSLLCYDFVTAIQPLDTWFVQLGSAFIASRPGHPIIKNCIETIKDDWHHKGAPKKTGPIHFTKSFYRWAGKNGSLDIALPPAHAYPLGWNEKKLDYDKWLAQGAYAVHHWAKSWMPCKYRLEQFKALQNDSQLAGWNE